MQGELSPHAAAKLSPKGHLQHLSHRAGGLTGLSSGSDIDTEAQPMNRISSKRRAPGYNHITFSTPWRKDYVSLFIISISLSLGGYDPSGLGNKINALQGSINACAKIIMKAGQDRHAEAVLHRPYAVSEAVVRLLFSIAIAVFLPF